MRILAFLGGAAGNAADPRQVSAANPLPVTATIAPPAPGVATKATFVRGLKAPAAIGAPEAIAAAGTYVSSVKIYGLRDARVQNVDSVYVDATAANDAQLIELTPGAFIEFVAPAGKVIDLGDLYVDAKTFTDGVFFIGQL